MSNETIENVADEARRAEFRKELEGIKAELEESDKILEELKTNLEEWQNPTAESQKEELDELRKSCDVAGIDFEKFYEEHKNENGVLPRKACSKLLVELLKIQEAMG